MFKFLPILLLCFGLTGCSLLPRVTFDRPNTVPQKIEKSSKVERCDGELTTDKYGAIHCTKGYASTENNFTQAERKLTLKESILNFFSNLRGWFFWIAILALIFCPGLFGWLIGRVFNVFKTGLESTVQAISNFKDKVKTSTDLSYIKAANDLLDELGKAHSEDPAVQKIINQIRAEIKK